MPLIEGLGDEVTFILILFTIIVVLLIAWLSTHARDIPFFSVIVLELSQRAVRNRTHNPEDQPQSVPSPEADVQPSDETCNTSSNAELRDEISRHSEAPSEARTENSSRNIQNDNSETCVISENIPHPEDTYHGISSNEKSNDSKLSVKIQNVIERQGPSTVAPEGSDSPASNLEENNQLASHAVGDTQNSGRPLCTENVTLSNVPHPEVSASSSHSTPVDSERNILDDEELDHEGQIRIRLKYLNDTQRLVYSSPSDTIGQFRRAHFSTELASNKLVRLIFNGQDMRIDTNTLQRYNITDNSVVHCLVTQNLAGAAQPQQQNGNVDVPLGSFMLPLFALILAAVWYLRVTQRQYFNAVSTLSLAGLTFLFLLGVASVWRGHDHREEHQHME